MQFDVQFITVADDLQTLVAQINAATWDEGNDIDEYELDALHNYLNQQDTIFIACYRIHQSTSQLAGIASARVQHKPYDNGRWLYIDEVDTSVDFRQQGVATALMNCLLEFAENNDCQEVWLGTEVDNHAANALYRSLEPDDIAAVVGYTYIPTQIE